MVVLNTALVPEPGAVPLVQSEPVLQFVPDVPTQVVSVCACPEGAAISARIATHAAMREVKPETGNLKPELKAEESREWMIWVFIFGTFPLLNETISGKNSGTKKGG